MTHGARGELLHLGDPRRLEARDWKGRTPLAKAASRGMTQVCKFLIAKDADLTAADAEGHVPRNLAAKVRPGKEDARLRPPDVQA